MTQEKTPILRARDVMQNKIVSIDGMATAREAAALMRSEKVSCLLVQKRHDDDAWGIVVTQDFIRGVFIAGRPSSEVNVYEIMTKPVISIPADMDIRYVARLLYRAGIRRAPVADGEEIIGMISLSSLILDNELF
ncbi:CBS domain-containing protein [Desulfocastanea catecholica]